jgi:hypothetical protein
MISPGLVDELVPGEAAVIDDVVIGFEDPVGEPVGADELPEVLDRVELRAPWRQGQERDVVGDQQLVGHVPAGLVEQEDGMSPGGDGLGDLDQMEAHALGGAAGQDQAGAFALFRADGAVEVGRSGALVLQKATGRVILFFCPIRASSWNQISIGWPGASRSWTSATTMAPGTWA